jgi:hypothetical protein
MRFVLLDMKSLNPTLDSERGVKGTGRADSVQTRIGVVAVETKVMGHH